MHSCPICLATSSRAFFELRGIPPSEGFLAATRDEALRCDLVDIVLRFCPSCGHIWNQEYDPEKLPFNPLYDISMYHSASYRAYVDGAIERLKSRYGIAGKAVLDIACGKGEFLRALIAHGIGHGYGFDPSFEESSLSDIDRRHITAHRAFYDESYRSLKVALVTCRSALQFFTKPQQFLESVRSALSDQPQTVLCFEVPNADETFARQSVWPITYDYPCFFSAASLSRLFRQSGFDVLDILPALGGSHMEIEARSAVAPTPSRFESRAEIEAISGHVDSFSRVREARVREWTERLAREAVAGRKIVFWGAGARALSFLCSIPDVSSIRAVVDVNPARQGRFFPKVGVPVIAPEQLKSWSPDLLVATNPNFETEIRGQLAALGVNCEFDVLR